MYFNLLYLVPSVTRRDVSIQKRRPEERETCNVSEPGGTLLKREDDVHLVQSVNRHKYLRRNLIVSVRCL